MTWRKLIMRMAPGVRYNITQMLAFSGMNWATTLIIIRAAGDNIDTYDGRYELTYKGVQTRKEEIEKQAAEVAQNSEK